MKKEKIKILLVQIANKNFGDSVIADNTRNLLQKSFPLWRRDAYEIFDYSIGTEDVGQVKYVDAVVFAGGGLIKFKQENLYRQVSELIDEAERYQVPVFLNSVGVEGYDESDERCIQIKTAINKSCVKGISVRDDFEVLKTHYLNVSTARIREVIDPAVWSEDTYGESVGVNGETVGYVGLGIARENLFLDYGIDRADRNFLLDFWKNLVDKLETQNISWKLFTNGLESDEKFALEVLEYIGHGEKVEKPVNQRMLVENIKGFQAIVACRMHANIIAYSYGIPSVGIVWNDKMIFWGQKSGYPERYITIEKLKADYVIQVLNKAMKEGNHKPSFFRKYSVYRELRHFVRKYCKKKVTEKENLNFRQHVFATAMGGAEYKYKNMNTPQMLQQSVAQGNFKFLEVDVRMTSDQRLVCVNGWTKATLRMLGIELENPESLTEEAFLERKYHEYYETISFVGLAKMLADLLEEKKDLVFILDVGKPAAEVMERYYCQLVSILEEYKIPTKNIIVRLQREKDVREFKKHKYNCRIAYYISEEAYKSEDTAKLERILNFCESRKIKIISVGDKVYDEKMPGILAEKNIKSLVMSYTKTEDIIEGLKSGAEYVGTHYYSVDYLKGLTK